MGVEGVVGVHEVKIRGADFLDAFEAGQPDSHPGSRGIDHDRGELLLIGLGDGQGVILRGVDLQNHFEGAGKSLLLEERMETAPQIGARIVDGNDDTELRHGKIIASRPEKA